jgi:hypothetical protein
MKKLLAISLAVLAGLASQTLAESENGGAPAPFLQLGLSARAVGMGQAYYAVADDAAAIFYNPGGAAHVVKKTVGFSYRAMDLDRRLGYTSINFPVRQEATIAVGWIFAGDGSVYERSLIGELGDELAYSENAISICFARRFSNILSIGGTGKFYIGKLANVTTTTVGFDLGTYIKLSKGEGLGANVPIDMLRIGAVVGNIAASYIWTTGDYWGQLGERGDSRTDDFPLLIGGGVSVLALDRKLLVASDVRGMMWKSVRIKDDVESRKFRWHSTTIHAGAEYTLNDLLRLRAGLDDFHPTFGFGIQKALGTKRIEDDYPGAEEVDPDGGMRLTIDYAFSAARTEIRADHIFSIGFAF